MIFPRYEIPEDILYRYEERIYSSGCDINGEYCSTRLELHCQWYEVIKRTPKGAWIKYCNKRDKKFVLLTARKQFASNTKDEAINQLVYRKTRQIAILQSKINNSINALKLCESERNKIKNERENNNSIKQ